MSAKITRVSDTDLTICVPIDWSNDQIKLWAQKQWPCAMQWLIPEGEIRADCGQEDGHIHLTLVKE